MSDCFRYSAEHYCLRPKEYCIYCWKSRDSYLCGSAQKIYFHGAKAGHKVDALKRDDKVCFTVYGNERIKKEEWAPYLQSVVIFGRCHLIDDPDKTIEKVRKLATKYYPNKEEVEMGIQKSIQATQLYEIEIEHMTGKQIQEK